MKLTELEIQHAFDQIEMNMLALKNHISCTLNDPDQSEEIERLEDEVRDLESERDEAEDLQMSVDKAIDLLREIDGSPDSLSLQTKIDEIINILE